MSATDMIGMPIRIGCRVWLMLQSPHSHGCERADSGVVIAIDGAAYELLLPLRADGRGQVNVHALLRERADAGIDANGLRVPAKSDATSVTLAVPRPNRAPQLAARPMRPPRRASRPRPLPATVDG